MLKSNIYPNQKIVWVCGGYSAIDDCGEVRLMIMTEPKEMIEKIGEMAIEIFLTNILDKKGVQN